VLDLFDKAVLPQIVLEEEEQSEESTDSDSDSDTAAVGANGVAKIP
jgi:rapamycin-insensitive companion of mTOR